MIASTSSMPTTPSLLGWKAVLQSVGTVACGRCFESAGRCDGASLQHCGGMLAGFGGKVTGVGGGGWVLSRMVES